MTFYCGTEKKDILKSQLLYGKHTHIYIYILFLFFVGFIKVLMLVQILHNSRQLGKNNP